MASRLELQAILEEILGSSNVYFQPPASIHMNYPAIVYSRKDLNMVYANDDIYTRSTIYEITVIDKNPDSVYVEKVSSLPYISFDRHYTADNLNHDVFTLYY